MEKAYETYKESGIEWIGKIPIQWDSIKLKFLGFLYSGLSGKKGDDFRREDSEFNQHYIPFTNIANNFVIDSDKLDSVEIFENENQNEVKKNDLFFLMSSENYDDIGKTSVLKEELNNTFLNSFCKGFRLFNQENIDAGFLNYLLSGDIYRKTLSIEAKGFTRINLQMGKIENLPVIIPSSKQEQTQIASYLDYHTNNIDSLISKKETLIQKLQEQRQAIINEAVTKGLNKNVVLKDSGIEWLGEIPEHWEVVKLFHLSENIGSGTTPKSDKREYYDGNVGWLNTGDLNDGFVKTASKNITEKALNDYSVLKIYPANSVVIALYGATIGKLAIIGDEMTTNQACCVLNPNDKLNFKFLFYLLMASRPYLLSLSYGGGQPNISQEIIKQLRVSLPEIKEQEQIIEKLEKRLDGIDVSTEKIQTSIQKLKDYRQSLISEAVTGKIDIRDWQEPNN